MLALCSSACVEVVPSPTAGQVSTLYLNLKSPDSAHLGSVEKPVDVKRVTFDLFALDDAGEIFAEDLDVRLFLSFGGVKIGASNACGVDDTGEMPIQTLHLKQGMLGNITVDLPQAYGATALWVEDPNSHAAGASPTIYFKNPLISDVQTPPDVSAPNAAYCSPFDKKFITIDSASPGGKLVVSSVYINAFAITDTGPGNYAGFNSIYLYSFGKPPGDIVPGRVVKRFSGNVSKFIGFTELNFPLFDTADDEPLAPLPAPLVLAEIDLKNVPKLLGAAAGVVQFTGTECDPLPPNPTNDPNVESTREQWEKYNSFVLSGDGTCDSFNNFAVQLTGKLMGKFDATQNVGKALTVTGMLRNNSGQNPVLGPDNQPISCSSTVPCSKGTCIGGICLKGAFNFWTINPRAEADIQVQ